MSYLLTQLVNGVSLGLVLGLIAVGFVVVFKSTGVLNFAHGSVLLLGAYLVARLHPELGFWGALAAGVAGAALVAALINTLLVRRVAEHDPGVLAILTIGVDILLLTELTRQIGNDVLDIGAPWGASVVSAAGVSLPASRAIAAGTALVLFAALGALAARTDWGLAMRAAAADPDTASLMGIRLSRTSAVGWGLAGALAAVAGVFLTSYPTPGVEPGVSIVAFAAIPAWVLGGFDSVPGAVAGGLVIGVAQALAIGYESELHFLGGGFGEVVPYAVMVLVLLLRPHGLFGQKEAIRV
ncbi:branched-chain amino acid ABC transporter permease [Actinomadura sp. 7K534]|uniref:branched-chain amino acid ABC transporter permease n=1 Tax=Actinomadura sp. 7K534 TaxID=2530366 RepID=UPI00104D471F|nr:branched-chain amino acid ABC transporter permease [Actinomadura sp. 7K534]TDB87650.1 branched-chain amino acid ABC transporter permease [Actinomadura sp. 7K534]